jgi:pimeloyl-ACP methyl ester carboxylesterase
MRAAARRPELVRSLILIETTAGPEPLENIPRYRLLLRIYRAFGPKPTANRVAQIMLGKSILADPQRKAEVARYVQLMSSRRDIRRATNGVIDRAPVGADELARITARTLVIVGDEDVATPRAKAEHLAASIRGAELVVIPRAGHSSTVEQPGAVTRTIERFLTLE